LRGAANTEDIDGLRVRPPATLAVTLRNLRRVTARLIGVGFGIDEVFAVFM
jgi:hypothetical protein